VILEHTARTLDASAALAVQDARRRRRRGDIDGIRSELAVARRASAAAESARARAAALFELGCEDRPPV
jgi:hypothetical protein